MKRICIHAVFLASAITVLAAPTISDVSLLVDHESPGVTVTYALSEDAVVTFKFFSNGVEIPGSDITQIVGDARRKVFASTVGRPRKFHWAADLEDRADGDPVNYASLSVQLTAWATNAPPNFMAADLVTPTNVAFYADVTDIPFGISNELYKTQKMLFRKIPAKEVVWTMGSSAIQDNSGAGDVAAHSVVFSDDYYIAVYHVTQRQSYNFCGVTSAKWTDFEDSALRPSCGMSYENLLGSSTAMEPTTSSCRVGMLIARTGIPSLNLPTEAQWEYACAALTDTKWYNGSTWGVNGAGKISWTSSNIKDETGATENCPQPVGLKLPNAWNLYDMAGNVFEYCLDWYVVPYEFTEGTPVRDPLQTTQPSSNNRVRRGGGYANNYIFGCTSRRTTVSYTSTDWANGWRPVCKAVAY